MLLTSMQPDDMQKDLPQYWVGGKSPFLSTLEGLQPHSPTFPPPLNSCKNAVGKASAFEVGHHKFKSC